MEKKFMKLAMKEAQKAFDKDEVPVGCVIVKEGKVIARGHNVRQKTQNALKHAEMIAIEKACKKVGSWRLEECDLYVTLEPCPMCAGACINARIKNIFFGAYDQKAGCCGTLYDLPSDKRFNHRPNVEGGILKEECAQMLSSFFKNKRK